MDKSAGFGGELRRLRESAGLSLADLSAQVHYSKSQISKIENGKARPSLALAVTCDEILHADGALTGLAGALQARAARRQHDATLVSGLPRDTPTLYGRSSELDRILAIMSGPGSDIDGVAEVCVVSGMGGAGKTALAVRAVHRLRALFPDGCVFLDLHGYAQAAAVTPSEALDRLLRRIGVPAENIPFHLDDRAALFRDRLDGKRVLLCLDNARDVAQVMPLLPAASGCRVLITSRSNLTALEDARRVRLGPLRLTDATDLVTALLEGTPLAGEIPEAERRAIARWSGYLPLAIRIAAARIRDDPWPDKPWLADGDRLAMLNDGERDLTSVFEYSTRGLPASLRQVFALAGLHHGPEFGTAAIAALAATNDASVRAQMRNLASVNLLTLGEQTGRYHLHDLLQEFARHLAVGMLTEADQSDAERRLIDYYLNTLDAADRILTPYRQRAGMAPVPRPPTESADGGPGSYDEALTWIAAEQDNLAAACQLAFDTGLDERCWQIAFALRGFLFITRQRESWIRTHELAVAAARRADNPHAEAVSLSNLGLAHLQSGDHETAASCYDQAAGQFGKIGDDDGRNTVRAHHAWVHVQRGELDEALRESLAALAYAKRKGIPRNAAILLRDTALIEIELGRCADAIPRLRDALDVFTRLSLHIDGAMALNCLGEAHHRLAQADEARAAFQRAAELSRCYGSPFEEARAHCGLGAIASEESDFADARRHWDLARGSYAEQGDAGNEQRVSSWLAAAPPGP
jgi:tetratricopeptide (TPR) repeat protein/transcriptional regulator with XRE-family HTH domain